MRWLLSLALLMFSTLALGQTQYFVNATTGSDSNNGTSATACGAGCGPWLTWNKANASATLGASGAVVNFADGTWTQPVANVSGFNTNFGITHTASASQPLTFRCNAGINGAASAGHCKLRMASDVDNSAILVIVGTNFITLEGFDIGGPGATKAEAGIIIHAKDGNGHDISVNQNYIHDVSSQALDTNGFGAGCPSEGIIVINANNTGGAIPVRNKFTGNFLNNGGVQPGAPNFAACNQYHGMYLQGAQMTIENNIVGNVPASGLKVYPNVCSENVSNNLIFRAGWWGILVKDGGFGGCAATGFAIGNSNFNNNTAVNNGFSTACSGIMQPATGSGTNGYRNNLLIGNAPNDNINQMSSTGSCLATALGGTIGTFTSTTGATFVNYQNNGTGNYHLATGASAGTGGVSTCQAGSISPCIPANDFDGNSRPTGTTQAVGPYIPTTAGTPGVSFSPSPLAFGSVSVSTTSTLVDNLQNTGTVNLTFSTATISGTNAGDFAIASTTCASPLAGGATCQYNINFTPTATGARSANLTLNDNAAGSPHLLPLTGTGGAIAVTFNPTSLSFGTVAPAACSATQLYTVTSSGTLPLVVGTTTLSDPNFQFGGVGTCTSGTSLAPGNSCTVSVKFCPTSAGAKTGNAVQNSNAPGAPNNIPLTGTGGSTGLTLTPTSAACGNVQVGSSSTCQAFTLTNSGTLAVSGIAVSITGTNTSSFSQSNTCPTSLNPSASCGITVFFNPASAGNLSASLTVSAN